MCGRYANRSSDKELQSFFDTMHTVGDELPPSYNVAPTQPVRVILERTPREEPDSEPQRQLRTVKWGLLPAWAKDRKMASKLINARSETVTEKPSFRSSAAKRLAIVPANGYYEWMKSEEGKKIPYFLHGDGDLIAMAGLYELWPDPELPEDDPEQVGMDLHCLDSASYGFHGTHTRQIPADPARIILGTLARPDTHRQRRGPGHDQLRSGAAPRTLRSLDCGQ